MESGRRRQASRPLADLVEGCLAPALGRFGFGEADIVSGWRDIAGSRIASFAEPLRLRRPRKGADGTQSPATLVLRVEGAFALELQHLAPALIERINAHLGWRCIGRLAFQQAPLAPRPLARPVAPPSPRAAAHAEALAQGIQDAGLRDALVRLGARVLKPR